MTQNTTESIADPEAQTDEQTASNTPTDAFEFSRRQLLGSGLASLATGLAGCTDSDDNSSDGGPAFSATPTGTTAATKSQGVFQSVSIDGKFLNLRFEENAAPLDVHLIDQDGQEVKRWGLDAGTLLKINLVAYEYDQVWRYTPGQQHRFVAYDGDEKVGETSVVAEPNLSITDLLFNQDNGRILVELTNKGSGPTLMSDAGFTSDSKWMDSSPIDTEGGIGQNTSSNRVAVPAGGKSEVRLVGGPLPLNDDTERCGGGQCRVTVEDIFGTRLAVQARFSLKKRNDDPYCDDITFSSMRSVKPPEKTTTGSE